MGTRVVCFVRLNQIDSENMELLYSFQSTLLSDAGQFDWSHVRSGTRKQEGLARLKVKKSYLLGIEQDYPKSDEFKTAIMVSVNVAEEG